MSEAGFALVFRGEIVAGFDRAQVMRQFGEKFGLPIEEVAKVFSHPRVVLKRGLSHEAAASFRDRLLDLGMAVSVDAPATTASVAAAPAPSALPATPAPAAAPPRATAPAPVTAAPPAGALPPAWAAAAPEADDAPREVPFRFSGEGFEFFRIWIVNILLGIVTLGIYSAWAKVRTQRYFYGNTRLDDASFEYLADPIRILKGRLIGFALLAVYMLADELAPVLGAILGLAFLAVMPWVIVRGLAFRNHNSAWRGVRFGFDGKLGDAYRVFLLWPLLGILTLGLLFPYAMWKQQAFIIGGCRYGATRFEFDAPVRGFYMTFLALVGVMVGGGVLTALLSMVLPAVGPLMMAVAYLVAFALFNVMLANLRFNYTSLATHRFEADYALRSYGMLMLTNTLATALTLGLFYPWAKVRNARYAAEHVRVVADGDLDAFAAQQRDEVSALGGEIGDIFDVDMGL